MTQLDANRLVFHIQPAQGIELRFQAKVPGPVLDLQQVDMKFSYGDAFKSSRYTGYEVMLHSCSRGDATLFSRGDLVEAAWRIAQPLLDHWAAHPAEDKFPNYPRNSWGPKEADDLVRRDGRSWFEVVTPEVLERSSLFQGADAMLLRAVIMALRSITACTGESIIEKGTIAREMYLISHGAVEVLDANGQRVAALGAGDFFGEIGLLVSSTRTATVRATTHCDLFVLEQDDFFRIMRNHPHLADSMIRTANERYAVTLSAEQLMGIENPP